MANMFYRVRKSARRLAPTSTLSALLAQMRVSVRSSRLPPAQPC
jgi:hypothetical protein